MLCPRCKTKLSEGARTCPQCGFSPEYDRRVRARDKIPNYLWLSLLMLLICLPMGAAALVYSVRVEKYVQQQDYPAARVASFRARKINLLAVMIMGGAAGVYLLFMAAIMLVVK